MSGTRVAAGAFTERIASRVKALRAAYWPRLLLARDARLWGDAPSRVEAVGQRLGWVHAPRAMRTRTREFLDLAANVSAVGFTRVLLLGMGGSSLAPEVLSQVFPAKRRGLPLHVLDDTSPAAVRAALAAGDPARTLVVVSSKSGGTVEVTSFERACFAHATAVLGGNAGQSFVAITDPGTALEAHARERGYRQTFTNPADIGGRYSAISCFGLVPATLLGLDAEALCREARAELTDFEQAGTALEIGAALGEMALAGRNKLTLVLPPELAPLGGWIEQLVAESTGKDGRGILPVDGERLAEPSAYANDRVFVSVCLGATPVAMAGTLDRLTAAGHPVIRWLRRSADEIGAEFVRWELVTAVASAVLGVNPFDEPNVAEAKAATKDVLARAAANGELPRSDPRARSGALTLYAPAHVAVAGAGARDWAAAFLALLRPGDYAAVLAWVTRTDSRHALLARLRHAIRHASRAATTLGYGPRYLHSTGQLHKGGPATGVFLQVTTESGDEPIPGESYGFRVLNEAQAAGDLRVLSDHGLRVMRVHVSGEPDAGLLELASAFEQAASVRS